MPLDSRRVKELIDACLELPERADRVAFLDRECGGDQELRQRLDALVASHEQAASAMESPLTANPGGVSGESDQNEATAAPDPVTSDGEPTMSHHPETPEPASLIGSTISGRYKLRQEIGEGGM